MCFERISTPIYVYVFDFHLFDSVTIRASNESLCVALNNTWRLTISKEINKTRVTKKKSLKREAEKTHLFK